MFEPLLELYEPCEIGTNLLPGEDPHEVGEMLDDLLDEDWSIFSADFPSERRIGFLEHVFNGGLSYKEYYDAVPVEDLWVPLESRFTHRSYADAWDRFSHHIINERRFVFDTEDLDGIIDPKSWLPIFLDEVTVYLEPKDVCVAGKDRTDRWKSTNTTAS